MDVRETLKPIRLLEQPLSTTGFVDLANLARAMERHSKSRGRITSELKLKLFGRVRIDEALDQAAAISVTRHNQQVEKNRAILKRLIAAVLYLGGQEQAFRGHSESTSSSGNRGNFMELVQTFAEFDTTMAEHLSSATAFTGTSKTIQNDIIKSTAHVIQEEIDKEINAAPFIAIEVDDTTDISCRCQLTVIVRYVNESGIICERFLGFHDISLERDAETIAAVVTKTIGSYNPETKLICQTYDGASCMSGQRGGVQALVKVKCRHALFVHCYAHKLNFVLAQGTSNIRESRLFFASLDSFHNFFSRSPKRTALLKEVDSIRVPGGSTTRWNFKSRAVHAVHEGRGSLITALDRITAEPGWDKDAIAQSSALRQKLDDFDFMFMLGVFKTIFGLTEPLFQVLQSRALAIRKCEERVNGTLTALKATRSTETFNQLYEETTYSQPVGFPGVEISQLVKTYPVFDELRLRNELQVIYADTLFHKPPAELLKMLIKDELTSALPEVCKLLRLMLTIPVSSTSAERSFSCLKRIKTYLRNSYGQDRLGHLAKISMESSVTQDLKSRGELYDRITTRFATMKDRRMPLLFK
ncbi:zinc finger MYM-type protein 1-like [Halichoeres trimaculatus]|uniref:zinc finger MYM-type protein 1-like n=1 Tax=Halichoeres trimaculatus TaxID=147232 RepID=UPI003D9F229A